MVFTNPLLLAGLAALAVPVLVHLIQRSERGGRPFPSLMFVRRLPFPARRRRTLRDPALLALRCLAVLLLVAAFAGPDFGCQPPPSAASPTSRNTVLLLDRSYSTSAAPRWQALLGEARRRIAELSDGERMAIVTFADAATVAAPLSSDRTALLARLESLKPGTGGTRLAAGVDLGERLLREAAGTEARLVLISDLQRSAVDALDLLYLHGGVSLEVVPVAAAVTNNLAVMGVSLVPPAAAQPPADRLNVTVRNTGSAPTAGEITVALGERVERRRLATLTPGAANTLTFPVVRALDRALPVRVTLSRDALAADNEHHAVLPADRPLRVGLLTAPAPSVDTDSTVFLQQALRVVSNPAVQVLPWRPDDDAPDVVVAGDAALADPVPRQRLERFVADGGGLLLFMTATSPAASPARGSPLVPAGVGELRGQPAGGLGVAPNPGAADHPLWRSSGVDVMEALGGARLLTSRRVDADDTDTVLAVLDDGAPWLVEHPHGLGHTVLMTSGFAGMWGNVALEPGFVPLLRELVRHLARRPALPLAVSPGDVVDLRKLAGPDWLGYLSAGGGITVEAPGGVRRRLSGGEHLFRTPDPGLYQAHRSDGGGDPVLFAANVDRRESLLEPVAEAQLRARTARRPAPENTAATGVTASTQVAAPPGWYLLAAALALLFLESQAANWLSWQRTSAEGRRKGPP